MLASIDHLQIILMSAIQTTPAIPRESLELIFATHVKDSSLPLGQFMDLPPQILLCIWGSWLITHFHARLSQVVVDTPIKYLELIILTTCRGAALDLTPTLEADSSRFRTGV